MEDYKGIIKLVVIVLVIAATVLGPVIERWLRRSAEQKGEPPPPSGEESEGPKLPYEDLAEEVFGPYMQRRRQAMKAREQAPPALVEAETQPEERPVRKTARSKVAPAPPAPSVPAVATKGGDLSEIPPSLAAASPPGLSLEERLFANRRLGDGAKLVIAAEILQAPKFLRGRSRNR